MSIIHPQIFCSFLYFSLSFFLSQFWAFLDAPICHPYPLTLKQTDLFCSSFAYLHIFSGIHTCNLNPTFSFTSWTSTAPLTFIPTQNLSHIELALPPLNLFTKCCDQPHLRTMVEHLGRVIHFKVMSCWVGCWVGDWWGIMMKKGH